VDKVYAEGRNVIEKLQLWQEGITETDGLATVGVTLEQPKAGRTRLWYRLPEEHSAALTKSCDPFVVATIFKAMRGRQDVVVHGQVSPSLLRNLEEFQAVWACWRPEKYAQVEITADAESEQARAHNSDLAICAFSGGVDSAFTAWRHRMGEGRWKRNLQAGVMVQGFDIGLEESDVFNRAAARSAKMLSSIGIGLIPMATNFRQLGDDWHDVFGAAVASCLILLSGRWACGLIGSGHSYYSLRLPHGSNPLTDRLLSSSAFGVVHDGAVFHRTEKTRELAKWPEALKYLRVCWEGEEKDRNCCRCRKCIRTILEFRAVGTDLPDCFARDVSDLQIASMSGGSEVEFLSEILETAKASRVSGSWIGATQASLWMSHLRRLGKKTITGRR
jgi:hypothetical protein